MTIFREIALGVLVALAMQVAPARAQQALKPAELGQIKADVHEAMNKYIDAFNRGDSKFIGSNVFANPSAALGADGVVLRTPDEIDKQYANTYRRMSERGWAKSVTVSYNICVLNANTAFFNGLFNRVRKDGSVIEPTATSYLFTKTKDGWRMALLIGHDSNNTMTCSD